MGIITDEDLTCHDFGKMAKDIQNRRSQLLFNFDESGTAPMAQAHYLQALAHLDNAVQSLKLADYSQMKN